MLPKLTLGTCVFMGHCILVFDDFGLQWCTLAVADFDAGKTDNMCHDLACFCANWPMYWLNLKVCPIDFCMQ